MYNINENINKSKLIKLLRNMRLKLFYLNRVMYFKLRIHMYVLYLCLRKILQVQIERK